MLDAGHSENALSHRLSPGHRTGEPEGAPLTAEDVESRSDLVLAIDGKDGILSDWSLPGAHSEAPTFDVARTVCRRAERCIVRLIEDGDAGRAPYSTKLCIRSWVRAPESSVGFSERKRLFQTGIWMLP